MIISLRLSTMCINIKPGWWEKFNTIFQRVGLIIANLTFVFSVLKFGNKSPACFKNVLRELIICNYWLVHWCSLLYFFHFFSLFLSSFSVCVYVCVCVCVCVCGCVCLCVCVNGNCVLFFILCNFIAAFFLHSGIS